MKLRVSHALHAELKTAARDLGVSVTSVVRRCLRRSATGVAVPHDLLTTTREDSTVLDLYIPDRLIGRMAAYEIRERVAGRLMTRLRLPVVPLDLEHCTGYVEVDHAN